MYETTTILFVLYFIINSLVVFLTISQNKLLHIQNKALKDEISARQFEIISMNEEMIACNQKMMNKIKETNV